jgi:hypothetical protein
MFMRKHRIMGQAGTQSRRFVIAAALMALAAMGLASSAIAAEPKGEFKVFKECPVGTEAVVGCLVSRSESGEIVIGNKKEAKEKTAVPIVATQTLQGGFGEANEATGQQLFYGAKNGETFSKTGQKVPGGLLDFVKCNEIKNIIVKIACEAIFENGVTGVTAVTELAKPASNIYLNEFALEEELPFPPYPPALVLPVKIKLENPLLGSGCYIGSEAEPIELALTTGATSPPAPNKSIHGTLGELNSKERGKILVITGNKLVGNAFAVGKAHGCGLLGILDGLIESKLGLPSPAGENTAILNNTVEQANASAVKNSEEG